MIVSACMSMPGVLVGRLRESRAHTNDFPAVDLDCDTVVAGSALKVPCRLMSSAPAARSTRSLTRRETEEAEEKEERGGHAHKCTHRRTHIHAPAFGSGMTGETLMTMPRIATS